MGAEVTVGIDIGTTSVKAIAADGDGNVLARARVPHAIRIPTAESFEHDVDQAWRAGVVDAYAQVSKDVDVRGVNVAAMVPSLGAVRDDGSAAGPGLLYGDARGRAAGHKEDANPAESGELLGFLAWLVEHCPDASAFWPAQAVANHALSGRGAIDTTSVFTAYPLFDGSRWDPELTAAAGATPEQMPEIVVGTEVAAKVGDAVLGGGTIDALAEQVVAGAGEGGGVLVICGPALITWGGGAGWGGKPGGWGK